MTEKCDCAWVFTQPNFSWLQVNSHSKTKNSKREERGRKDTDGDIGEKEGIVRDKKMPERNRMKDKEEKDDMCNCRLLLSN